MVPKYEYKRFSSAKYHYKKRFDDVRWLNELGAEGWLLIGELFERKHANDMRTLCGLFCRVVDGELARQRIVRHKTRRRGPGLKRNQS